MLQWFSNVSFKACTAVLAVQILLFLFISVIDQVYWTKKISFPLELSNLNGKLKDISHVMNFDLNTHQHQNAVRQTEKTESSVKRFNSHDLSQGKKVLNVSSLKMKELRSQKAKYMKQLSISPVGGLGNHMFQYAALLGIALVNQQRPIFLNRELLSSVFKLPQPENATKCVLDQTLVINEAQAGKYFEPVENIATQLKSVKKKCAHLGGFYQSWKYFHKIETEVRNHFTLRDEVLNKTEHHLNGTNIFTRVGVHIRRGDYLWNYNVAKGFTIADRAYLERAVEYFNKKYKNVLYVVCSDDMQWSMRNFPSRNALFIVSGDRAVDFGVLSRCDHTIMTVGSFGWWAAWLVNGTTVYFKDWPKQGSSLDLKYNKAEYFYPHWIPL